MSKTPKPEVLRNQYEAIHPAALRLLSIYKDQIEELLRKNSIPLAVPLEARVKTFASILQKLDRRDLEIKEIKDVSDLVGLRVQLLFKRDVDLVCDVISNTFEIIEREDTAARLKGTSFGYQSVHYLVELPSDWQKVPTISSLGLGRAEIQVRTLAQHLWAAASHILQYKHESSAPLQLRRTISRVSALLETVDLEYERVLSERQIYIEGIHLAPLSTHLDVDLLRMVLDKELPATNKDAVEDYSDLLPELEHFNLATIGKVTAMLRKHLKVLLKEDKETAKAHLKAAEDNDEELTKREAERYNRGVYFTHVGLTRLAIGEEIGYEKWKNGWYRRATKELKSK